MDAVEDDAGSTVKHFTPAREVFCYKAFSDCFVELDNKKTGLIDDYINKLNKFIFGIMTAKELKTFLSNRKDEVSTNTKHTIHRIRLTVGEHLGTGISRIFYCFAKEIPAFKENENYNGNDIVLLYFTYDEEGHNRATEIFQSLNNDITIISEKSIRPTKELKIIKNNLTYRFVRNRNDEYNSIPVLSPIQRRYLSCCTLHPPCIIHGSAGSGKTVLSEELYQKFSEDPNQKSLYVTYMDQLKLQVSYDLKNNRNIDNTECKTIDDIVREYLGEDVFKNKYKKEGDFKEWVLTNEKLNKQCMMDKYKGGTKDLLAKINRDLELSISITYIFYRTFSVESDYRSFTNNPNRQKSSDLDYFLQQCSSEEGLDDDQKKRVFYLCQKYENYLKNKGFINDNEAARRIAAKNIRKYDNVIIDEVQDLTETQIKCLTTLLKDGSSHFYVFGDDNQSINPTMMDISDVRTCLRQQLNMEIDFPEYIEDDLPPLDTSFRSTTYLVNYINYINRIRRDSIGRNKSYNEKDQKTALGAVENNESDYPAFILDGGNTQLSDSCLNQKDIVTLNDVVIITANSITKDRLLKKFPHLNESGTDYVCTIEETKGREWSQVILYNFFSSAESIWNSITRDEKDKRKEIVSKGRHSSIYRMYFNRYYVGLTRAKNKIIIIETDDISDKIKDTYFLRERKVEDVSLEQLKDKAKFNEYFKNEYTHDVWDKSAHDCFKKGDYEEALTRQRKAIVALDADSDLSQEDKEEFRAIYENKCEKYSAYQSVSKRDIASKSVNQYLTIFIEDRNIDFMISIYEFTKERQKINLLRIDPKVNYNDYLSLFEQLNKRMTDVEKEFFNSNAILAYREKILKNLMGESRNG